MKDKLRYVSDMLAKYRSKLEDQDKCGPIPYIDEAIENIDRAMEELEMY